MKALTPLRGVAADVFLYDAKRRTTRRVSVSLRGGNPDGASVTPTISDDGR
jgi:hypothetical protein